MTRLPAVRVSCFVRKKRAIAKGTAAVFNKGTGKYPITLVTPSRKVSTAACASRRKGFMFSKVRCHSAIAFMTRTQDRTKLSAIFLHMSSLPCFSPRGPFPMVTRRSHGFRRCSGVIHGTCLDRKNVRMIHLGRIAVATSGHSTGTFSDMCNKLTSCQTANRRLEHFNNSAKCSVLVHIPNMEMSNSLVALSKRAHTPLFLVSRVHFRKRSTMRSLEKLSTGSVGSVRVMGDISTNFLNPRTSTNTVLVVLGANTRMGTGTSPNLAIFAARKCGGTIRFCRPICRALRRVDGRGSSIQDAVC